jgi:hypothetical protein
MVRQRFALVADIVFLLLAGAAAFIFMVGGVRWQIGGLRLTAGSGARAAAIAIIVLVARHAVVPDPSFAARLLTTLRHVKRLVRSRRLAGAADVVIVSLGALAFTVDLAGGVEWRAGALEVSLPDGTRLALAAVTVWLLRRVAFTGTSPFQLWLARWRERASPVGFEWPSGREWLLAAVVFGGATVVLLRQQMLAFTSVPDLGDPLFSMWRLAWVAHQLPRDPMHLFDGNIFHPAVHTLAYSDAALLPALIAAPALWLGAPLAVVYTSLILFSFVAAGLAMFALARAISGHMGGALIGGLVFAFDPFRFSHYSHLELEFTFWMPLAALCVLRALTTGDRGAGVLAGVLVALQGLSSLYYGAYLAVSLAVLVMCWIAVLGLPTRRALVPLAITVLLGTAAAALVTIPYWTSRSAVGERTVDETRAFSARGRDYLTASRHSAVYGTRLYEREGGERELFPGALAATPAGSGARGHDPGGERRRVARTPRHDLQVVIRAAAVPGVSRAGSISSRCRTLLRATGRLRGGCHRASNLVRLAETGNALGHRYRGPHRRPSNTRAAASLESRPRDLQRRGRPTCSARRPASSLGSRRVLARPGLRVLLDVPLASDHQRKQWFHSGMV